MVQQFVFFILCPKYSFKADVLKASSNVYDLQKRPTRDIGRRQGGMERTA